MEKKIHVDAGGEKKAKSLPLGQPPTYEDATHKQMRNKNGTIRSLMGTTGGNSSGGILSNGGPGCSHIMNRRRDKGKKTQTFMEPVYKMVGINDQPTSKELGTLILLGAMVLLFIISFTGFIVMWFTEYYDNAYVSKLIIANNSDAARVWADPPVDPLLKVHIFNYTNIEKYLSGEEDIIRVEDVGPFTYQEHSTKVNVQFNANFTVTYNDHRAYKFLPEKSGAWDSETVTVPNIPLLTAAVQVENMSYFKKSLAITAINAMNLDPFKKLVASEFMWGYKDEIISTLSSFMTDHPPKFGMLMNRNGTSPDRLQMYTGEDNIRNLGLMSQFNGMPTLNFWSDNECNRIDGSDGSVFPPYLMDGRKNLYVFIQALCRRLPLHFSEEVTIFDNVDVWRYRTPMNVFAHPDDNPANECYCDGNMASCPPSGVFNGTKCYGAPIFPSFPHFFSGDPVLYEKFEGIKPEAGKHQTFADIHPRLAFPVDGASRIQINIALHKGHLVKNKLRRLEDGLILPVLWIEVTSGDLSEDLRSFLFHSTFSVNAIQYALKYGTLLTLITSFALIVAGFYYLAKMREKQSTLNDKDLSEMETLRNKLKASIAGGVETTTDDV